MIEPRWDDPTAATSSRRAWNWALTSSTGSTATYTQWRCEPADLGELFLPKIMSGRERVLTRRYLVGEINGNPGWGWGIVRSWGCVHRASALKLFEKRVELADAADVFVFDRETRELIARREKATPQQDQEFIRLFLTSGSTRSPKIALVKIAGRNP